MGSLCQLFVLLDLADEVNRRVELALEPLGLSRATFEALRHLAAEGAPTQKALAEHAGCAPSNVTRRIDRLEKQGLVERLPDPGDRRVVRARPTATGRATLEAAIAALSELQAALVARLAEAEGRCATDDKV